MGLFDKNKGQQSPHDPRTPADVISFGAQPRILICLKKFKAWPGLLALPAGVNDCIPRATISFRPVLEQLDDMAQAAELAIGLNRTELGSSNGSFGATLPNARLSIEATLIFFYRPI
ncbi:unnamed protein product [Linum trigynum]|uniref:Uncharacterized protein n=1 Tax=Linum trigynum TaxID=586398 RepID=A0AAV2E2T8_9ROSI